jgi:predicted transcriptional regulator
MKYRSRTDIMSQILDAANGCGATRGMMVYKAFLNYDQLQEYTMLLIENDLLHYDSTMRTFKTTEKGLRFLHVYNEINSMAKEEQPLQEMWIYR